ncbi:uncharacterized protein LOC135625255 [Musa acuminata AAA Group]|uniref:uncharacterized protein LOC135625255 n=1 Tax=Musa acuminata AAA Group TaxID=214697 RepID=UPI0031D97844
MKKGACILLVALLSVVLRGVDRCAAAVEVDTNATGTNIPVANSVTTKAGRPRLNNAGEERKSAELGKRPLHETKKPHDTDTKGSSNETRDKPLEVPKIKDANGNQSLESGSNPKTPPLEDPPVEGCDPSNRCIDEKNKFVACLRVPGKDSLYLSLLIENRGTKALDVKIVAPDFVNLERTSVKLQAKRNEEVKVFVKDGANDTTIILNADDGNCSLNLRNMIPTSVRGETSRYLSFLARTLSISMFLGVVVLVAAAWLCIRLWRTYGKSIPSYQKVDMVLPVSTGGSKETDEADGWDNSWGDDWDDEAPKTPQLVSTPSSKGLASRRLNKDGWKD